MLKPKDTEQQGGGIPPDEDTEQQGGGIPPDEDTEQQGGGIPPDEDTEQQGGGIHPDEPRVSNQSIISDGDGYKVVSQSNRPEYQF